MEFQIRSWLSQDLPLPTLLINSSTFIFSKVSSFSINLFWSQYLYPPQNKEKGDSSLDSRSRNHMQALIRKKENHMRDVHECMDELTQTHTRSHAPISHSSHNLSVHKSLNAPPTNLFSHISGLSLQVNAIPYIIWAVMSARNWRNTICPLYVYKQLRFHTGIFCGCRVGLSFESLLGIFWQPWFGHCYASPVHFHSNCFSIFDTKRSHRDISIGRDDSFAWYKKLLT